MSAPGQVPEISAEARRLQDEEIRQAIMAKLIESGEKDRMKEFLREKLHSSGWHNDLKDFSKDCIRRKGTEKIGVEELVLELIPHGRNTVPQDVKNELQQRIRDFLQTV